MLKLFSTLATITTLPIATLILQPRTAVATTFDLLEATVPEIQSAIDAGVINSEYLVQQYLNRIAAYDDQGPALNSIIELNPNALETAKALDLERSLSGPRGPLFGIPILLKDNIDTFDMPTTAGGLIFKDSIPPDDAFITQQLRDAGAIILGKVNLTEFAAFIDFDLPAGFSTVGGQTLNPYGPGKFEVGGSSSGSAVAIAANLAALSVGTDTGGSILHPTTTNSLVGIRPTVGLISRDGIIPISATQDTAGPMTRTVQDAAILLGALTGIDPNDPATAASQGKFFKDYTPFLNPDGLVGARLGVVQDAFSSKHLSNDEIALSKQAFEDFERLGAELVYGVEFPPNVPDLINTYYGMGFFEVLIPEFKVGIEAYLASLGEDATLDDMIAFNQANAEAAIPFGQEIFELSQATKGDLNDPKYLAARGESIHLIGAAVDELLESLDLDALIFPNDLALFAGVRPGYPIITVPAGYTSAGQPFGLSLLSEAFSEPKLIELAYAYEQGTLKRLSPASTPAIKGDLITVPEPGVNRTLLVIGFVAVGLQLSAWAKLFSK